MDSQASQLYARLGAVPVINAMGNMTMLGGSSPSPRVAAAMQLASRYYVDMDALLESSGQVIAAMLGCEAALVTSGCAAALLLGTAACMTGSDPVLMGRLPDTTGMRAEVVMQKAQRFKYDRVVRMAGTCIVEAGDDEGTTEAELAAAIGPGTVAVLYPAHDERPGLVPVRQAIEVAHARGVPIIVDAASRVYPLDGLRRYTAWGADLVGYGAKYIGAPNSTGILCGRRELVDAARRHSFASFEKHALPGYGRPLKVDRQEVAAVVEALHEWLETDHKARFAAAAARGRSLRDALTEIRHLTVTPAEGPTPTLSLSLDEAALGWTPSRLAAELRCGNPSIWVQCDPDRLHLQMLTVHDGDEAVIAARLREILGAG